MKNSLTRFLATAGIALLGTTGSSAFALDAISNWSAADGLPGTFWNMAGGSASAAAGVLTIDTSSDGQNTYFSENTSSNPSFSTAAGLSIEARLNYNSGSTSSSARDSVVIAVTQGGNWGNGLFVGNGRMFILSDNMVQGATATVATQGFHTYRIDVGASTGNSASSFNVFYDGQLTLSGSTFYSTDANGPDPSVYWGEGSSLAHGKSEWQFVRNVTPVPEPETYALLLAGLGLMGAVVKRRSIRQTRQHRL